LNDDDLTDLRREHIGFIFQFFNLIPTLTALDNTALSMGIYWVYRVTKMGEKVSIMSILSIVSRLLATANKLGNVTR